MNLVLFCCGIGTRVERAMIVFRASQPLAIFKPGRVIWNSLWLACPGGAS